MNECTLLNDANFFMNEKIAMSLCHCFSCLSFTNKYVLHAHNRQIITKTCTILARSDCNLWTSRRKIGGNWWWCPVRYACVHTSCNNNNKSQCMHARLRSLNCIQYFFFFCFLKWHTSARNRIQDYAWTAQFVCRMKNEDGALCARRRKAHMIRYSIELCDLSGWNAH